MLEECNQRMDTEAIVSATGTCSALPCAPSYPGEQLHLVQASDVLAAVDPQSCARQYLQEIGHGPPVLPVAAS